MSGTQIERRFITGEVRLMQDDDGQRHIRGYGAVFDELSSDLGGFRERIAPGAFAKTIQEADVRSLWNHDRNYVLGRNKSGTLTLMEDDRGLLYDVVIPDAQWARDLVASIERGDVDGSSFGFRVMVDREAWEKNEETGEVIRTLREVQLYDVGPVTFPAYPQTSAEARSTAESMTAAPPEDGHPADDDGVPGAEARARRMAMERNKLNYLEHGGVL